MVSRSNVNGEDTDDVDREGIGDIWFDSDVASVSNGRDVDGEDIIDVSATSFDVYCVDCGVAFATSG